MKDDKLNRIVNSIIKAIDERMQKKPRSYYTEAEVLRVDERNGVAYVHIPGGVDETPAKLTIDAKAGDKVQIRVGDGTAVITGNHTAPPTDDKVAEEALQEATTAAKGLQKIDEKIENGDFESAELTNIVTLYCLSTSNSQFTPAPGYDWTETVPAYTAGLYYWTKTVTTLDDGSTIETDPVFDLTAQAAAEANAIATSTDNHFWHNASGVYVTKADKNAASGYATRIVSEGIQHTYNGNPLFALSGSALTFYQSDGSTPMATYGSNGVYLYAGGAQAAQFTSSGITLNNGSAYKYGEFTQNGLTIYNGGGTTIADLGFGNTQGLSTNSPFFTFGTRSSGTPGAYSLAQGRSNTASGVDAHAEGYGCTAGGAHSHAEGDSTSTNAGDSTGAHSEGRSTSARGDGAHAEGYGTTAYGTAAHAEGEDTTARGSYTHAGGFATEALYSSQTAVGTYNSSQSGDLFEVGNGTDSSSRSNAFSVDRSGNATVKGALTAGNIAVGSVSIVPTAADTPTSASVSFGKTFPSAPQVVVTPESRVAGTTLTGWAVTDITTTGFTAWVTRANTTSTTLHWIAIG